MAEVKKKKVNGKQKGNAFERVVSNKLSDRFKEKTGLDKSFRRSIDSGSFFGASNQKRMETHNLEKANFGDIICPSNFNYEVECKSYKTPPTWKAILEQDCKQLDDWIDQATQDSKNSGKKMMLIMKFNNVPEMVLFEELPEGLSSIINYKQYSIVTLTKVLLLPDEIFFS
jgi:hypothetical protein